MPPNTVKVDRTTRFGNPFIVGAQGTAIICTYQLILLNAGMLCLSESADCVNRQEKYLNDLMAEKKAGYPTLRGKNLACWCRLGQPCHADVLIEIANRPLRRKTKFDLDAFLADRYGYRVVNGIAEKIA